MPQTKTEIKRIMIQGGLWANRRLGQHFLIDGNLMTKLVTAAEIGPQNIVLEVGAGTGSLTEMLLDRAAWVVAVEIDRGLFRHLAQRLAGRKNLSLINSDVLRRKRQIADIVIRTLVDAEHQRDPANGNAAARGRFLMVSNLPYNVASPLLIDLLACGVPFERLCFTVQSEVAERMLADPGSKRFGPLSIALQSTCSTEKLFTLPSQVFWPVPAVESTALRLEVNMQNFENAEQFQDFLAFVHLGFTHRRKTLLYNLKRRYAEDRLESVAGQMGVSLGDRPEQIEVIRWLEMYFILTQG